MPTTFGGELMIVINYTPMSYGAKMISRGLEKSRKTAARISADTAEHSTMRQFETL